MDESDHPTINPIAPDGVSPMNVMENWMEDA